MFEVLRDLEALLRHAGSFGSGEKKDEILEESMDELSAPTMRRETTVSRHHLAVGTTKEDTLGGTARKADVVTQTVAETKEVNGEDGHDSLLVSYFETLESKRQQRDLLYCLSQLRTGSGSVKETAQLPYSELPSIVKKQAASENIDTLERAARLFTRLEVLLAQVQGFTLSNEAKGRCKGLRKSFDRILKEAFLESLVRMQRESVPTTSTPLPVPLDPQSFPEPPVTTMLSKAQARAVADMEGCLRAFLAVGQLSEAEQLVRLELVAPQVNLFTCLILSF